MTGSVFVDGIGGGSVAASAANQTDSVTKGFLIPRMTTAQRNAIATPAASLLVYDTDLSAYYAYIGAAWVAFAFAGGSVAGDVTLTPGSDARNVIQPTGDFIGLTLKNNVAQVKAPFQLQSSAGAVLAQISAAGAVQATALTLSGNGARITGDMSTATIVNRLSLQTSVTNGNTNFSLLPNGSATTAGLNAYNNSDPTNASYGALAVTTSVMQLASSIRGSGTYLPMDFLTSAIQRMRIEVAGGVIINDTGADADVRIEGDNDATLLFTDASTDRVGIGTNAPATKLHAVLTDSATNAVVNVGTFGHIGGTVAAGFGTGILLTGEDSTTPDTSMARLRSLYTTVTHASYATRSVLSGFDSTGERDVIGWGANGSAGLFGLHDKAGAPVAQSAGWAVTNPNTRKTFDTTTITLPQLAEVVGTIITYLISRGDFAA